MKTMETELQRLDNELYIVYQRSFEIAMLKWLPNITPKKDSYNSYPHIKGVMAQIDRLLYEDENRFSLNCSELYILLCAILMHDIGKGIYETPSDKRYIPDHAFNSYKIIVTHWASLGLLTEKVAEIVADICRFHDCPDQVEMEELYTKYYIDQFKRTEPIRGRLLGALLFLGDHMDTTFTRVVPSFLKENGVLEIVGNFRNKIADVRLDRQHKMIRQILDKTCFEKEDIKGGHVLKGDLYNYLDKNVITRDHWAKRPEVSALYAIAKDVVKSEKDIALIKDELNIMGMPVKKWLIECDEHLFEIYREERGGQEKICSVYALEPIINLDYCLEVLRGICILSGGIFAGQYFQYSELVNFIHEEERNKFKIECAVRRLSLLLKAEGGCGYVIYYDENNWSFYCRKKEIFAGDGDQKEEVYDRIKKIICERLDKHHG